MCPKLERGDIGMARRLKSMADLRRYLADLINRVESGELDAAIAGRLGYLVNIQKGIIEGSDLERRIGELEKAVNPKT